MKAQKSKKEAFKAQITKINILEKESIEKEKIAITNFESRKNNKNNIENNIEIMEHTVEKFFELENEEQFEDLEKMLSSEEFLQNISTNTITVENVVHQEAVVQQETVVPLIEKQEISEKVVEKYGNPKQTMSKKRVKKSICF